MAKNVAAGTDVTPSSPRQLRRWRMSVAASRSLDLGSGGSDGGTHRGSAGVTGFAAAAAATSMTSQLT